MTGPASAQPASYCNGSLQANSFYSNVMQSAAGGADVEYHGQFQNMDPQRRSVNVRILRIVQVGPYTAQMVTSDFDLGAYHQKDITILKVRTNNASGAGAPTPAQVRQALRLDCTFY